MHRNPLKARIGYVIRIDGDGEQLAPLHFGERGPVKIGVNIPTLRCEAEKQKMSFSAKDGAPAVP
jgi:hypothetical protein